MAGRLPAKLFIDTGAFIALCDRNDVYHREAIAFYTSLTKETRLFTTLLVVSETYTWLRYRVGYSAASLFLEVIKDAVLGEWLSAETLLHRFRDQDLSYSDAVSFAVLKARNIADVVKKNLWPDGAGDFGRPRGAGSER
ncbi:MAG: type II toxin-antitoxin system VapC family toxin [Moorellales bacterium]